MCTCALGSMQLQATPNNRICPWIVSSPLSAQELIILFLFSFLFNLSTLFLCILASSCSYLSFSSFFARFSLIVAILAWTTVSIALARVISHAEMSIGIGWAVPDALAPAHPSSPSPLPSSAPCPLALFGAVYATLTQILGGRPSSVRAIVCLRRDSVSEVAGRTLRYKLYHFCACREALLCWRAPRRAL